MSSCSPSSRTPMCKVSAYLSTITAWLPRIAFGVVLAGFGVAHYRDVQSFATNAGRIFIEGSILSTIATLLAYIVPALMIIGGVLFAIRQLCCIAKFCIVAVLSGIIGWAGLGIMFMDPTSADAMNLMQQLGAAIQNAAVLFILYVMIKKMTCCSKGACSSAPSSGTSCCK